MRTTWIVLIAALAGLSGCRDDVTGPRDTHPPAAPRGFYSVTGDNTVYLSWYDNTESDVVGYRIYQGPCDDVGCPYTLIGTSTDNRFTVTGLPNGTTTFFAVAAYDASGNEGELSRETVFDTPRPEGFGATLIDAQSSASASGWDFSAQTVRAWDNAATDMYFMRTGSLAEMIVPLGTDIQDAGFGSTLDAVDFAPDVDQGWSPTGTVELIEGHCYVVWTDDDHYAKFRVTNVSLPSMGAGTIEFDWAYQVDADNRELRARPARDPATARRPMASNQ